MLPAPRRPSWPGRTPRTSAATTACTRRSLPCSPANELPAPLAQAIGAFSHDAWLYLASAALIGFAIFGGIYSLLVNMHLLRLGYGSGPIGVVNAAGLLGWALACLPSGRLGCRWGSRRAMVIGITISMAGHLLLPLSEIASPGPWHLAWLVSAALLGNVSIVSCDVNSQPFLATASAPAESDHLFSVQPPCGLRRGSRAASRAA